LAKPIKFAIVGTGNAADLLLAPALRSVPGAELHSVVSRDLERAEHFALVHGATATTPAFDDPEECFADPALDAVIIATPDGTHAAYAVAAAKAKKHVFCEKPIATTALDARAMIDACRRAKVRLGIGYHLRFHAGHRMVAEQLAVGAIGRISHMRVQWTYDAKNNGNWRAERSLSRWWSLAGVGTHGLDLIRWWMMPTCGEVVQVRSMISHERYGGPNDETAIVLMRFESGATAELVSSVLFESPRRVEVFGEEGAVMCEGTLGPYGEGTIKMRGELLRWELIAPYEAELASFVRSIRENREPEVSGEEGLRNIEIMLHASDSERRTDRNSIPPREP
jgi:1,5-anhydro-D-fructose reductase (1,5-anhydro-D-mannitol-forming)